MQRLWASEESNYINRFHRIEPERKRRLEELPGWAWRTLEDKWEKTFPILQQFVDREGHSRVPVKYRTDDGIPLGLWVSRQRDRFARGILVDDRVRRLEALPGWVWNAHPDNQRRAAPKSDSHSVQWRKGFTSLQEFSKREGHARVLKKFRTAEGFALGIWVAVQRQKKSDGRLSSLSQQEQLESLPGWSWAPQDERHEILWEEGFSSLKEFLTREGHSRVQVHYTTETGFKLGRWVARQRFSQVTMNPERIQRLQDLPGWVWKIKR